MAYTKGDSPMRRRGGRRRRKVCAFCTEADAVIDYKDVNKLKRYISESSNGLEKDGISGASGENQGSRRRKPARCSFESGNQCKRGIDRI